MSGDLIDLGDSVRDLKGKLSERWSTEHTHFMELMKAVIPAANMIGEPMVSVGWHHVVQRVTEWRRALVHQQSVLDMAALALAQGMEVADIMALLNIQRNLLDKALDGWEPVPLIPSD